LDASIENSEKAQIIIGEVGFVLPFHDPLIIVDEEHEQTLNRLIPHHVTMLDVSIVTIS
jgi:hypothetical protein